MSNQDLTMGIIGYNPDRVNKLSKKPNYLITLTDPPSKKAEYFIAMDKPDPQNGFILVKGFFCDNTKEEIISSYSDIVTNTPKEMILELMIPNHRVRCIRSLVFNANKTVTRQ